MKPLVLHLSCLVLAAGLAMAKARRAPADEGRAAAEQQTIELSDDRKVIVNLPEGFVLSTSQDARGPVNARITDARERVAIELTFLPDTEGRFADSFARKQMMHQLYQKYLEGSVEQAMQFEELEPKVGKGTYCVFTDKQLVGRTDPPPNEYLNATAGVKAWPGVVALFSILSNGTETPEYRAAMTMLRESVHERLPPLR